MHLAGDVWGGEFGAGSCAWSRCSSGLWGLLLMYHPCSQLDISGMHGCRWLLLLLLRQCLLPRQQQQSSERGAPASAHLWHHCRVGGLHVDGSSLPLQAGARKGQRAAGPGQARTTEQPSSPGFRVCTEWQQLAVCRAACRLCCIALCWAALRRSASSYPVIYNAPAPCWLALPAASVRSSMCQYTLPPCMLQPCGTQQQQRAHLDLA